VGCWNLGNSWSSRNSWIRSLALVNRSGSYDGLVDRFSTRNLPFAKQSGHDRFFEAFGDFSAVSGDRSRQDDMVAEVANRAASQHTSYDSVRGVVS
jgi:hypothetical protein